MRCNRVHKDEQSTQLLTGNAAFSIEIINKAHHCGNSGIELHPLEIFAYLFDAAMHRSGHFLTDSVTFNYHILKPPYPLEESAAALDSGCTPRYGLVKCSDEHFICSDRIRTVFLNKIIGVDDVIEGLTHLSAVLGKDHSVAGTLHIRLGTSDNADIIEELVPEP